jgi:hypothetical protein
MSAAAEHRRPGTIAGGNILPATQDAAQAGNHRARQRLQADERADQQAGADPVCGVADQHIRRQDEAVLRSEHPHHHQPAAHTDGDSLVFFRRSDVISTVDIFTTTNYPVIDLAAGGTINGIIDGLNKIIDLIIPVYGQEGGTLVIPGHGRLCDLGDVINYREMATIVRDRVQDLVKKGQTLEQVKAAKPTRDYDPLYGSTTGFWTTDMFVEAVYKTLSAKKS